MSPVLPRLVRFAAKLILAVVLLVGAVGGWAWWDMHRLTAFCQSLQPRVLVVDLPRIAMRAGLDGRWLQHDGVFDDRTNSWVVFMPAKSTMWDMVCAIHHNRSVVISAQVWGP